MGATMPGGPSWVGAATPGGGIWLGMPNPEDPENFIGGGCEVFGPGPSSELLAGPPGPNRDLELLKEEPPWLPHLL